MFKFSYGCGSRMRLIVFWASSRFNRKKVKVKYNGLALTQLYRIRYLVSFMGKGKRKTFGISKIVMVYNFYLIYVNGCE